MATDKQINANRRNALKSPGPVSVPGKRRSSLNALKLGTFAKSALLPNEDPKELSAFARGLYADWQPVGTTERALVDLLISTLWRSRRLHTVEAGLFEMYKVYKNIDGGPATAFVQDGLQVDSFGRLVKSESALERRLFRLINQLERLQKKRKGEVACG
jgi:hypothetical protein